jgi:hypothetical protein
MAHYTPFGAPVPIEQLQVGSVYSPLSDRIDRAGYGEGSFLLVTRRLSRKAVEIRLLIAGRPTRPLATVLAANYPPNTMFQRYMTLEDNKERARDVRNARLVGEYRGLPHGVESTIAQFVSGIPAEGPGGKNAAQQADLVREQAGVPGVMRDPNYYKQFSGRRRTRQKTRKHTRRLKRI